MQINTKITVLDSIEKIGDKIKSPSESNNGFDKKLETLKEDLIPVSNYLNCNESQALFFSVVFFLNITDGCCSIIEIGDALKCNAFEMIRLEPEIAELMKNKFIMKLGHNNKRRGDIHYVVPQNIVELISKDKKIEPLSEEIGLFGLAEILSKTFQEFRDNEISFEQMLDEVKFYEQRFPDFGIFKLMSKFNFSENEKILIIYVFMETCSGDDSIDIQWALNKYLQKVHQRVEMRRLFMNRKAYLITTEVLEFNDGNFRTDRYVKFTNKATEIIFGDDSILFDKKSFNSGNCILIECEKIKKKELFYNEDEIKQLEMFEEILQAEKYKTVVERLIDKKLPPGITSILHGYPGTGKTESVYQLARKSNRNILMVDISQIRDKYVGESEKQLKEVFNIYRRSLKHFDNAPILLFNESDSLISKRINVAHSVDQMNNSMQNVLLQELEDFNGILIATTNLIQNMDSAFERRFLFKVKFSKPCVESRSKIWQSKIETLNNDDALMLANRFEFSGGQIDNITKKILMNSLLTDKSSEISDIAEYCENELFNKKESKKAIGFVRGNN